MIIHSVMSVNSYQIINIQYPGMQNLTGFKKVTTMMIMDIELTNDEYNIVNAYITNEYSIYEWNRLSIKIRQTIIRNIIKEW